MKIIQARIRGLGKLEESRWFELSPHLNLFQFPDQKDETGHPPGEIFFQLLQTINPTYEIQKINPFANFPNFTKQGRYTRRVNPAKRSVVLTVFSATPSLVQELATADEWLYETDRIEVGRRLDYSRWINFVEIASSTRWSEISTNMQILQDQAHHLAPDLTNPITDLLHSLRPAERIKNELQDRVAHWLNNLPSEMQIGSRQLIETTISAVRRADHFKAARDIVSIRLPLLVVLGSTNPPANTLAQQTDQLQNLLQLIASKTRASAKDSLTGENTFLDELNEQLATSRFSDMSLRINNSSTGMLLRIDGKPSQMTTEGPSTSLRQIQAKACLAVAFSRVAYKTEPILLFAAPDRTVPNRLHGKLADFVSNISATCQCLYSFSDIDIFRADDAVGRRYSAAELYVAGEQLDQSSLMPMDGQR